MLNIAVLKSTSPTYAKCSKCETWQHPNNFGKLLWACANGVESGVCKHCSTSLKSEQNIIKLNIQPRKQRFKSRERFRLTRTEIEFIYDDIVDQVAGKYRFLMRAI